MGLGSQDGDEEACQGFQLFGDSVWCLRAMGTKDVPDPLGLSYGIEQRDLWSEKLSNVFRVPTRLYDCFVPPRDSPPMAGTAPNASGPCDPSGPHCYETPYRAFRECLGPRAGVVEGRTVATLGSHLEGRGPLSTWLKIDVEGSEWSALEQLLESEEGMARVRTLEMEVHFSYAPFVDREAFLQLPEQERLERRVRVMERLLKNFACVGSNLEVYREQWHPETECPGSSCDEPQVHVASMSVDQFAVSYVNRALLPRGE
ncbi:unnamed protein product [Prorocentrum cordatum]|uniref:Methyltransferase domain-containing protein n=1 Tax=Prorocentrum cordatum TaxID=2364126 RepID=A0ABN9UDK3_9DINO|nr:unnamed protein product [Polarella glacialis]